MKDSEPPGNSIQFITGSGCTSPVGMQGGAQRVTLNPNGCNEIGTVVHEIAHSLGAFHEQSRSDRDSYVTILKDNIKYGQEQNFRKESTMDYEVGHDYGSVMHYMKNTFAINPNKITIKTRDPMMENVIGQNVGLSFFDVKKMNLAYCSSICKNSLPCANMGYVNPNNCNVCKCPPPYGGKLCDRLQLSGCGDLTVKATSSSKTSTASGAKTCYFLITAPPGKKIYFKVLDQRLPEYWEGVCRYSYIEIKLNKDFSKTGPRFCKSSPTISQSKTNEMMIVYQGYDIMSFFTMEYRSI